MLIKRLDDVTEAGRSVEFAPGGFMSHRFLLQEDGLGFTVTKTVVPVTGERQEWIYPNHTESCYCISGKGLLYLEDGTYYAIAPDTLYAPARGERHYVEAIGDEPMVLVCVFSPALVGTETHHEAGGYPAPEPEGFRSPVYNVRSVPIDKVTANDYNPNRVAPPEMALLETSIWEDGYTQPVVTVYDAERDMYVVVDGFHRFLTLTNSGRIREREGGMLPVVVLDKDVSDRMASTIRHNRARGSHHIDLMSQIVSELVEMGKSDGWICKHIGMSPDELLRMKQITGVAALFQNHDFSQSWEAEEDSWDE